MVLGPTRLSWQMRIDRPMGPEARALLQSEIERGYDEFLERVSTGRKKTREQIDSIAQGRVWAGVDAEVGSGRRLGSFDDATKAAARRAKLTDYEVEFMEPELSWAQEFVLQMKTRAVKALVSTSMGASLNPLGPVAKRLDPADPRG